jgi:CRISPR/Cas system-associated endonuclease Cas1
LKSILEPYLGFLHSEQFGKPSLVCDFQELYRYLIDDFVIQYCQRLARRDFTLKTEKLSAKKKGKRQTIETLISEEALLFAKYLRNEKKEWVPRIGIME